MTDLLTDMREELISDRCTQARENDRIYKQDYQEAYDLYKQLGKAIGDNQDAHKLWFDLEGVYNVAESSGCEASYRQGLLDGINLMVVANNNAR